MVGESGSGKSTLGRLLMSLTPPTAGQVRLNGEPILAGSAATRRDYWRSVQLVFQDPFSCLNPTRTIGQTLSQPYATTWADHAAQPPNRSSRCSKASG